MKSVKIFLLPYYLYRLLRDMIYCFITIGKWSKTWRFHSLPLIQMYKGSTIEIGEKFVACSNPKYNSIGFTIEYL